MGTLKVSEFVSLDGMIGVPTFTFAFPFTDEQVAATAALTGGCSAILLGRKTFDETGPAWASRPDSEPGAAFFNGSPKYVVGASEVDLSWNNSSAVGAYSAARLRELKASVDGGIYCYGSGTLVQAMLADGLVDELHLFVYPVTVGSGPRLFPDGGPELTMTLGQSETYANGVLHLDYRPHA